MNGADKSDSDGNASPHLSFVVEEARVSDFSRLFQNGVTVKAHTGCSVTRFLREEMGLSPDTIDTIQSIFLDGSPVDDLDSAVVRDGSSLAFSAAMPGLVGATLRREGAYSSFRSTITHRETGGQCVSGEGFVKVKLFNLLMAELGPDLLKKGVFVRSSDLMDFLAGRAPDFWQGCRQVILNGRSVEAESLSGTAWLFDSGRVFLSVASRRGDD